MGTTTSFLLFCVHSGIPSLFNHKMDDKVVVMIVRRVACVYGRSYESSNMFTPCEYNEHMWMQDYGR